jgi:hypothetical protein
MSQAGIIDFIGTHPEIPILFVANVGSAVPIANTLEILGDVVAAHGIPLETVGSGNTISINVQYASAAATSVAGNAGVASFSSIQFSVDANGFVTLNGSVVAETITGNTGGPLSPVAGNWNILGTSTAAGTIPVQTAGSGNTLTIQVQKAQAIASTNAANVGLAAFNNTQFNVDANGFVSLSNIADLSVAVDTFTAPGTNPVVPTAAGVITVTGSQVPAGTTANVIRTDSLAANSYTIQIQRSQAVASSTVADNGVSHFNSAFFTVDSNGFVSLNGSAVGETITGNTGGALTPTAGNWNIFGAAVAAGTTPVSTSGTGSTLTVNVQTAQAIASTNASNIGLSAFNSSQFSVDTNGFVTFLGSIVDLHAARFIVSAGGSANGANFTTIATAYAAAVAAGAPQTVVIQPGTYAENIALTPGINLTAFGSDSSQNATGVVIINGTCTLTTAGSVTISGIQLQTNSAALLAVTGSVASVVNLQNCYLNCLNNTGITFSSSSSSAAINVINCRGNLGTTGIKLFDHSSAGSLLFQSCLFNNSGGSSTASTISAGTATLFYTILFSPITSSGTSTLGLTYSGMDTTAQNVTCITFGGSGTQGTTSCSYSSGTASAMSISSSAGVTACYIASTNTNTVAGAGTLNYNNLIFPVSQSAKLGTTTQVGGVAAGGLTQAPSSGFIGEQIRAFAGAVSFSNNNPANVTSISLTAGVWDVTGLIDAVFTGIGTTVQVGISPTTGTLAGNSGDQQTNFVGAIATNGQISLTIPAWRVVLTATANYFLIANVVFSTGACTISGRISATRVG